MPEKRSFSDEQIAQALATLRANGGNAKKTARDLGISRTTLRDWAGRNAASTTAVHRDIPPVVADEARTKLARTYKSKAQAILDAVTPEKLEKASAKDLLIAAGIATEKAELLTGGATSRTESVRVSLMDPAELRQTSLKVIQGGRQKAS